MSLDRIDSHQHFLKPGQITYSWMEPGMPIAKDFLPSDLEPILKRNGFAGTILVEAADNETENEFLFELAEQHDFIAGVVIWLNMEDAQFKERLSDYQKHPKFVGIRPMIESIPDDDVELLKIVLDEFKNGSVEMQDMLVFVSDNCRGMYINGEWYEWDKIKHLWADL